MAKKLDDEMLNKLREAKGEVIGGGYIVLGRYPDGRLRWSKLPFEHGSLVAAQEEAKRLSSVNGLTYYVGIIVEGVTAK